MTCKEEILAQDLLQILTQEFADSSPRTEILIKGGGRHWTCTAMRGKRSCSITPLLNMILPLQYVVSFDEDTQTQAKGWTCSKTDAVSAFRNWLQGQELSDLYKTFQFVDRGKRFLKKYRDETVKVHPELEQCTAIRFGHFGDFHDLWFVAKNRSCRVVLFDQDQFPTCHFNWDDRDLFELLAEDTVPLALLLKRWLCDYVMPSTLKHEFPWLNTGKIAEYYEAGRGVEGEFILSWDSIEQYYQRFARLIPAVDILKMISQMREVGYDKTLRAGQSVFTLILSRSLRHGLRPNQPRLAFEFHENGMKAVYSDGINAEEELSCSSIEYTPQIDLLMKRLEAKDID